MNRLRHIFIVLLLITALQACRKEPVQSNLADSRSLSEIMYDIPFNGGAIEGRWTLNYEEYLSYVNDIPVGFDSATHVNGLITLEFYSNGNVRHINQGDTTTGTYTVAGSQLTLALSSLQTTQFGIADNRLHCQYTNLFMVGGDLYRDINEYLFSRY